MDRQSLYKLINDIIPTYSIGQLKGALSDDCAILRRSADLQSVGNSCAFWDNWYLDVYSPKSPLQLDKLTNEITEYLKDNSEEIEIANKISGDLWDTNLNAFTTTMNIRFPSIRL